MIRKFLVGYRVLPVLTRNQLAQYFPHRIGKLFAKMIDLYIQYLPNWTARLVPKRLAGLFANFALLTKSQKAPILIRKAGQVRQSAKLSHHYELEYVFHDDEKFNQLLKNNLSKSGLMSGRLDTTLGWAYWNLSIPEYQRIIQEALGLLTLESGELRKQSRSLPEFSSNMGHLGFLTSYIGYYSQADPLRCLEIWTDKVPNDFFMKLIKEQSPLVIQEKKGPRPKTTKNFDTVDNLAFSREPNGNFRVEFGSGVYSGQKFPELHEGKRFILNFPTEYQGESIKLLETIGFNPQKWFVALHIRGLSRVNHDQWQSRDADILNYRKFCERISDLGGQVVRMGSPDFDKLASSFPAIDYAWSDIRSPMLDCWLWSNCRWWTGNANGASIAAFAFGATRLISDQWYWDNLGPESDFHMPRVLVNLENSQILTLEETIQHKLSRNMSKETFRSYGLYLRDQSSEDLANAADDLFEATKSENQLRAGEGLTPIEHAIGSQLNNIEPKQVLKIPKSYAAQLSAIFL